MNSMLEVELAGEERNDLGEEETGANGTSNREGGRRKSVRKVFCR